MRILIAGGHGVVRRGLREILAEEFPTAVFAEAPTTGEVLQHVRQEDWDVVVLDTSIPGRGGLYVLKELKHIRPRVPVLVLSIHPENQFAVRSFRAGASGYVTIDSSPEQLVEAVRGIFTGDKYVSTSLAEQLALCLRPAAEKPCHEFLSDREYQVMRMIDYGRTITEIAKERYLSAKTISTYRSRTLEKMRMRTNAELTRYAIENHLAE